MRTPSLLLCAALLNCSGCAMTGWSALPEPPRPIDCDAAALAACEAPALDPAEPTLADSEEVDAINAGRWERCIYRHNAARACLGALRDEGVLRGADTPP